MEARSIPKQAAVSPARIYLLLTPIFAAALVVSLLSVPGAAGHPLDGAPAFAPASGLALTLFLLTPKRRWLRLALVVVALSLAIEWGLSAYLERDATPAAGAHVAFPADAWRMLLRALAILAEGIVGARILRRGRGPAGEVDGMRSYAFLFLSVALAAAVGAGLAALASHVGPAATAFAHWRGRALGSVLTTPVVLALAGLRRAVVKAPGSADEKAEPLWRTLERVGLFLVLALCLVLAFGPSKEGSVLSGRAYVVLPPLFWAALRFDLRAPAVTMILVGVFTIFATLHGAGPFRGLDGSIEYAVLAAQTFLAFSVATVFLGAAAIADRRRAEEERHVLEKRLARARQLEAIGRLAKIVAGEVETELTMVRGYCERLRRERRGDDVLQDGLGSIAHATARAAEASQRMFALGSSEVPERQRPDPIALAPAVDSLAEGLRRQLDKGVRLVIEHEGNGDRVRIAEHELESILNDLVANANAAVPGGGTIHVRTGHTLVDARFAAQHGPVAPGPCVVLQVEDDGCGMDADTLEHSLEPGFTTRRAEGAMGLGLPAACAIAEGLGGALDVDSRPGEGTRVRVLLPPAGPADSSLSSASHLRPADEDPGAILLVEDEKATRDFLLAALEGAGYEVLVAPEGEAAIELAFNRTGRIGLLIADIELPGRDGVQVAQEFLDLHPEAQVLFISGAYTRSPGFGIGGPGSGFLAKPFTVGDLLRAVERARSHVRS